MGPTVSVVISAYNADSYLRSTIESLLNQTYPNIETLVVDDGSTDGTAAIARSFGSRVRYVHQPNSGLAAARNTGIRASAGEILALLDADDVWMPNLVELQVEIFTSRPSVDGVYAWAQFVDQHGKPLPDSMRTSFNGDMLERLLLGGNSVLFSMAAVRRRVFDTVGLFDPNFRQAQDWDMTLRMAAAGIQLACIPQLLVHRRIHPANVSGDPERGLHWDRQVLKKAFATLPLPSHIRGLEPVASFWVLHRAAMGYWRRGERGTAAARLLEGFVAWPGALRRPQTYRSVIGRLQPSGYRGQQEILRNLDRLVEEATELLREVFRVPDLPQTVRGGRRAAWAALHAVSGGLYFQRRNWRRALQHLVRGIALHPIPLLTGVAGLVRQKIGFKRQ